MSGHLHVPAALIHERRHRWLDINVAGGLDAGSITVVHYAWSHYTEISRLIIIIIIIIIILK
jgi:hypothetical protein